MVPQQVPQDKAFSRVVNRFKESGSVKTKSPPGPVKTKTTENNIAVIRDRMEGDPTTSIRKLSSEMSLGHATVWRILRKDLKMYPYKPKNVQPLTEAHKAGRLEFSRWLLDQPEEFADYVLWSDEKMLEEKIRPNKQNERYWGVVDPEIEEECRVQGGKKIMCWAGLIHGEVILHWFEEGTVNQLVYLDMLENVVWPRIRSVSSRRQYFFQQDGATAHTTLRVREWLATKFRERIISRYTNIPWPSRSPDLSPLDYWLWSVCLAELRRNPPSDMEELKEIVQEYINSLEPGEIIKACRDITPKAMACIESNGGVFEYKLKKSKRKKRSKMR